MSNAGLASGRYLAVNQMSIPLVQSRYGGPVVDLLPGATCPDGLPFVAQLDLAVFSGHDLSKEQ